MEIAGITTPMNSIKYFMNTNVWKATMLLSTLLNIQVYQNIINNITGINTDPIYTQGTLILRELFDRTKKMDQDIPITIVAVFISIIVRYYYCKSKG